MANMYAAGAILLFIIHHAISDLQPNNILSSLYKKAAAANRPMILVLDNDNKLTSEKDLVKKQSQDTWAYKLLKSVKEPHRHGLNPTGSLIHHRNVLRSSRSEKARERDRQWLRSFSSRYDRNSRDDRDRRNKDQRYRSRSDRDRRDRDDRDRRDRNDRDRHDRDDWDRRDRYRDDDRRDRDRDYDRRDRDRDDDRSKRYRDDDRRDRDRDERDRDDDRDDDRRDRDRDIRYDSADRDQPSIDRTLRQLIEKTLNKSKDEEEPHTKAIQTSVIKQLLRANNYFSCNAQDKCKSKCEKPKCHNACEQKFECEPEPETGCDECDLGDSCGGEDDGCNPSTRGVPYEPEPAGCKRCKK